MSHLRLALAHIVLITRRVPIFILGGSLLLSSAAWGGAGDLLWEDQVGAAEPSSASAILARGNRVFAAGSVAVDLSTSDFLLRTYEATTGELVWSDRGPGGFSSIAEAGGRVFAAGATVTNGLLHGFLLRAYDAESGDLLWANGGADSLRAITATRSIAFAAGVSGSDFLVRAYSAETGVILWEDRVEGSASVIAAARGRVFVGGRNDANAFLLRAYDARTGELLWQDETEAILFAVAVDGQRVFAAGAIGSGDQVSERSDFLVRAYDASVGSLLWEHRAGQIAQFGICNPPVDPVPCTDIALAVEPKAGRLFVAGESQNPATGATASVVRAYQARTGALLWEAQTISTLAAPRPVSVVAADQRVFTVSRCCTFGAAPPEFLLRTYDAETGSVEWEDVLSGFVSDAALASGRVLTAGMNSGLDFWVRAYDLR